MGGLAFRAPVLATMFLIVAFANLAMPGTSNFAGEFLILLGAFQSKMAIAIIASAGVVLASVYTLRLFIRAMHNRVGPKAESREMSVRDGLVLVPLVLAIIAIALYPQLALDKGEKAVIGSVATARDIQRPPKAQPTAAAAAPAAAPATAAPNAAGGAVQVDPATGQPVPEQEIPTP
jgi:NADH-quinone oxidoreductase subunit M